MLKEISITTVGGCDRKTFLQLFEVLSIGLVSVVNETLGKNYSFIYFHNKLPIDYLCRSRH